MYNIVIDIDRGFMYYLLALGDIYKLKKMGLILETQTTGFLLVELGPASPDLTPNNLVRFRGVELARIGITGSDWLEANSSQLHFCLH